MPNELDFHFFLLLFLILSTNLSPGDGGYARDAKLKSPSSLAVSPNGSLYIADLGNVRIRRLVANHPQLTPEGLYELTSVADQELYLFSPNGTHLFTCSLVTGDYLLNFTYTPRATWAA